MQRQSLPIKDKEGAFIINCCVETPNGSESYWGITALGQWLCTDGALHSLSEVSVAQEEHGLFRQIPRDELDRDLS